MSHRVLIVDDNKRKRERVLEVVTRIPDLTAEDIDVAEGSVGAVDLLLKHQYCAVIIDIRLPMRDGEDPIHNGGMQLVRRILTKRRLKRPYVAIGLTAYEDVRAVAQETFSELCWAVLLYDPSSTEWEDQLVQSVDYALSIGDTTEKEYSSDLGVVVALAGVELEAVRCSLTEIQDVVVPGDDGIYLRGNLRVSDRVYDTVVTACTQMGMPAASVATCRLIQNFRPRLLAMCGIAAGNSGRANLGDILAADPSWDYGSGKVAKDDSGKRQLLPDPYPVRVSTRLGGAVRRLASNAEFLAAVKKSWKGKKPDTELRLHLGPVGSGASVVADSSVVEEVQLQARKLLGIEMEAYGFMFAARDFTRPRPDALVLKSVCDFADDQKDDSFQEYAAYTSVEALKGVLLHLND